MANQFISGAGNPYDPTKDPNSQTLAAGVNAGQALPNLDPGKMGNPYAGAAQSVAQNVSRPQPAPAANSQAPSQAPAQSSNAAPGPAAPPPPAAGQPAGSNPPNPYMPRAVPAATPAAAPAPAAQSPAQMAASNAMGGAPVSSGITAAGGWSPTVPTQTSVPGSASTVFDPAQFQDYGKLLFSEAQGNQTPAQQMADKQDFASQYYDQGMKASENSAGRGLTGQSGASQGMQQAIAGSIAKAQTDASAARQQQAQEQYGQLLGQGLQQSEYEQNLGLQNQQLQQNAQQAFNSTMTTLAGQTNQANISQNQINAQQNQPFWNAALGVAGNVAGTGINKLGTLAGLGA